MTSSQSLSCICHISGLSSAVHSGCCHGNTLWSDDPASSVPSQPAIPNIPRGSRSGAIPGRVPTNFFPSRSPHAVTHGFSDGSRSGQWYALPFPSPVWRSDSSAPRCSGCHTHQGEYVDYKVHVYVHVLPQFSRLGIQVSLAIYVSLSRSWLGWLPFFSFLFSYASVLNTCISMYMYMYCKVCQIIVK